MLAELREGGAVDERQRHARLRRPSRRRDHRGRRRPAGARRPARPRRRPRRRRARHLRAELRDQPRHPAPAAGGARRRAVGQCAGLGAGAPPQLGALREMSMRRTLASPRALALAACGGRPGLLPAAAGRAAARARRRRSARVAVADISLPAYADALEIAVADRPGHRRARQGRALGRHAAPRADPPSRRGARGPPRRPRRHRALARLRRPRPAGRGDGRPHGRRPRRRPRLRRPVRDRLAVQRPLVASDRFAITIPPQGEGYPGLIAAHARAIEALADRIAASIAGRPTS